MFAQMINQAFRNIEEGNYELALLSVVPQFDKACKKQWPKMKVGERFRKGVEETEDVISFIMVEGRGTITKCKYGEWTLPQLTYKYLRNSIVHEGTMPGNVKIVDEPKIAIKENFIQLPVGFVKGLLIATIGFPCFKNEASNIPQKGFLQIKNRKIFMKDTHHINTCEHLKHLSYDVSADGNR
jgi:hypothetical protein